MNPTPSVVLTLFALFYAAGAVDERGIDEKLPEARVLMFERTEKSNRVLVSYDVRTKQRIEIVKYLKWFINARDRMRVATSPNGKLVVLNGCLVDQPTEMTPPFGYGLYLVDLETNDIKRIDESKEMPTTGVLGHLWMSDDLIVYHVENAVCIHDVSTGTTERHSLQTGWRVTSISGRTDNSIWLNIEDGPRSLRPLAYSMNLSGEMTRMESFGNKQIVGSLDGDRALLAFRHAYYDYELFVWDDAVKESLSIAKGVQFGLESDISSDGSRIAYVLGNDSLCIHRLFRKQPSGKVLTIDVENASNPKFSKDCKWVVCSGKAKSAYGMAYLVNLETQQKTVLQKGVYPVWASQN